MKISNNFVVRSNGDSSKDDLSPQIQHCNALSTKLQSVNHSLVDTMKDSNNRYGINSYTNDNFHRDIFEGMSFLDTPCASFIEMIDPLPLPPNHGNNHQSESRQKRKINTILENAIAVSRNTKGDSMAYFPSMTSNMTSQRFELKRNHDLRVERIVVPSAIDPHFNHKSVLQTDFVTPIDCGYINRDNLWTSPSKKAKISHDQSLKPTIKGPVEGTSHIKTKKAKTTHGQSFKPTIEGSVRGSSHIKTNPTAAAKTTIPMALKCDEDYLSEYQCLVRQQIEIFEASEEEVQSRDRGRNSAIVMGQVGIRCKHCAKIAAACRPRGSNYYTSTLNGLYQAAQKMTTDHFFKHCKLIPQSTVASLLVLKQDRRRAADGKRYWAEGARSLGIRETDMGLRRLSRPKKGKTTNSRDKTSV